MEEIVTFINANLVPHWPFFAAMVIFMLVGEVLEANVFTETAFKTNKPTWLWWWGHKTLSLQPIVLGIILGTFWKNPVTGVDTWPERTAYFALAGGLSIWAFAVIKGFAKKEGIDLDIPGIDDPKPPQIAP